MIELLVVIATIAALAGILVSVIDVEEYQGQSRDSKRIAEVKKIDLAIRAALTDQAIVLTNTATCTTCNSIDGTTAIDGTGWVEFNNISGNGLSNYVLLLPLDPTNESGVMFSYHSDGTGYEVNAVMQSRKYQNEISNADGGNEDNVYEQGTDLTVN